MIKVASKNKKKRSYSPEESNNSFVKNVTSTVSYLLPSSITKWFSTSSSSKANGSTPKEDATDSSSEDEIPETSVLVQPPPKRMRYNSGKLNHLGQSVSEVNYSTSSVDAIESYDIVQATSSTRNPFKREPYYVSTPIHTVINEPSEKRGRETTVIKTTSYSTKAPSVTKKRKSLYDMFEKGSTEQGNKEKISKTSSSFNNYSQPYFNIGLASSPFYRGKLAYGGAASSYMNQPNIKASKTTRVNESSNHDNTISYSARRVMDLLEHYSSPLSEAKRISPYVTSQNNSSFNQSMENSCLRCENNHSYKTQELHVPSIASILSLKHRSRLMATTNAARQLIASHSSAVNYSPYPNSNPQSKSLNTDNREKLTTKVKNRITRTTRGDSTDLVNELSTPVKLPTAVLEIDQNNLPKFNFGNPVGSTPIRVNVATIRNVSEASVETKSGAEPKDLQPSEQESSNESNSYKFATPVIVSRDLTNPSEVPKFTFEYPMQDIDDIDNNKKKKTSQISTTEGTVNINTEKPKDWKCSDCWVNNKADASNCVCCSAKKPSDNTVNTCLICNSAVTDETSQDKCSNCKEANKSNGNTLTPLISSKNSKKWKCGDCWVDNAESAEKCVCCGSKNPTIAKSIEKQINAAESDWKCNDCWVKNNHNIEKCIACGGAKPNSTCSGTPVISLIAMQNLKTPSFNARNKVFDNILNTQTNKWECSNCLVRNDNEKTKCVCCETEKTSTSSSTPALSLNPVQNLKPSSLNARDTVFDNTFKIQSNKWECSSCLVKNDNEKTKCVCCETEKTGVVKETKTTSFNFGMNTITTFKFGIDPKAQVDNFNKDMESEEYMEQSSANDKLETNNNVLANTPTFTFGFPINKNKNTFPNALSKATEAPKLNFTFGMPNPTASQPTNQTASTILESNIKEKVSTLVSEEKPQEVPSINFSFTQTQNIISKPKNIFESNKGPQESLSEMPNSSTSGVVSSIVTGEKSISFKPLIVQTTTVTETSKVNTFTFAQSGLKIASNLFSTPTSTVTNVSSSNNTGILPVPTTTTSSFFKKSDLNIKSASGLFQRVESAPSNTNLFQSPAVTSKEATASTFTTSSKLFSFGSNTQSSLPEPSQSKFNFSFGNSNKTDTSPVFNTTFGINQDPNTSPNSNKFTLSIANNGGSHPSLPGSPLVTGNLITSGNNPIMSNTSSGNNGITPVNPLSGPSQKENMWSNTNNSPGNLFESNAATNSLPATFSFGSSTPFNANNNAGTTFGNNTSNVFNMQNPSSNMSTLFSTPPQQQTAPIIFGNPHTTSNPAPTMGVFGSSNSPTINSFNVPALPTFEAQAQNPIPAPSFNFGAQQLGTGVFGFGQQQPQQQFQGPVYNFSGNQGTPQFNMGSAPTTTVRRVRKAVRRTTQR